jgi:hypothetical protein
MFGPGGQAATAGAWVVSSSTVDRAGQVLPSGAAHRVLAKACDLTRTSSETSYMQCADQLGLHEVGKVHPGSHFWTMQIWESIIFCGLGAGLAPASASAAGRSVEGAVLGWCCGFRLTPIQQRPARPGTTGAHVHAT